MLLPHRQAQIVLEGLRMISNRNKQAGVWRSVSASALLLCLVVLISSSAVFAQNYAGSINGTVTDPSGAAVPGATVTVISSATNATYNATTSDLGAYSVPGIPVGKYEVHIKVGNFKEYIAKDVEVHTSTVTELNAQLAMGASTESVTVEASDVQVQTTSAAVGEVVEGQQVRELPLNGENFMGLVTLSPGVSAANSFNSRDKGLAGGSDFSVNGNPYTNNLFLVDGVNNNDMGSNRTILVYPSVDAIAEFKMLRNSYGPEYGQASGAIISINTKSGENQFHGGIFYAGRNDALNANDWFSNNNGTGQAKLRRNDYGYNASGPIIKNRFFVWWNQEWNKEIRGQSFAACVPTAAEKHGDFSQGISCGANTPDFSTLPAGTVVGGVVQNPDAAGLLLAQFYPDPNIPGATGNKNNWRASEPNKLNWREENGRLDFDVTKKHRITFRYTQDSWTNPAPNGGAFWGDSFFTNVTSDWSQPSKSVMVKLSSQLTDTLINDIHFGYGYNAIVTNLNDPLGIVSGLESAIPNVWPTKKDSGAFLNGGGAWGGLNPYGSGQTLWNIAPYGNHEDLYTIQDNLLKVHGNHTFKVGAFWSTNAKVENNNGGTDRPTINPNSIAPAGFQTNNPLANILLPGTGATPQVFQVSENSINANDVRIWHDFEWYVGDTWKVRRNLTVEYGFRWSFFRETYNEGNQQASFSLAAWDPARATLFPNDACNGVIIVPGTHPCDDAKAALAALGVDFPLSSGTPGPNRALVNNANHDIAPRLGVAWDVRGDGKTAVRAGIGQFYQRELVGPARSLSGTAPFVIGATVNRPLDTAPALTSNISVSPSAAKEANSITPNSWQWNLSVERQLARNTALQVGYVGNVGIHLTSMQDLNFIQPSNWLASTFGADSAAINANRPAFNFGQISEFARRGHASYHALQMLFRSRLGNMSSFQASYTYSHSVGDVELDNSSGGVNQQATTDQTRTFLDKGNTNINRPHIFVANEVFYLPKLSKSNAFIQNTIGGWEVNSIVTVQTGTSFSVFTNGANGATVNGVKSTLNSLVGTGFNQNNRPLITGVGCNSGDLSGKQIWNPAAFTLTGYTVGTIPTDTAARGACFGPHSRNFDFQFAKNWFIKERFRIKFSVDAFNIFNHANFKGTSFNNGYSGNNLLCSDPTTPCSLTNNVISSVGGTSNFGQATQVQPGRELQYGLKISF